MDTKASSPPIGPKEAARRLGISRKLFYLYQKQGKIPVAFRLPKSNYPRFDPEAIEKLRETWATYPTQRGDISHE